MTRIAVGVIGTGFIGPAHIEAIRRLQNVDVVALADIDEATARVKAESLGVAQAYGDYRKLLARDDVRVVHICTPNHLHFEMSKKALEAGKHVVCEKPLAMEAREAAELVELAARKGLVNAVHFNVRYYPLMRQVKVMAQKGEIGDIFSVHGSYLQDWLYYSTDYNWRLEPKLSGKSRAVADIGSHWMDLIEHVSGLKIAEVFADFATFHKIRKKPRKPVETYCRQDPRARGLLRRPHRHGRLCKRPLPFLRRRPRRAHRQPGVSREEEQAVLRDGRVTEGNCMGFREPEQHVDRPTRRE